MGLSSWFKLLLWTSAVTVLCHAENSFNHSTPVYIPQARKNDSYDSHDSYDTSETSEISESYISNITSSPPTRVLLDKLSLANNSTISDRGLDFIVAKKKISKAYVQKDVTLFKKEVPFQKVRSLLSELRVNLLDISVDDSDFSSIKGTSGIRYYSSNWASRPSQNMLKCAGFKGRALSIDEMAEEKFTLRKTYITSDKFIIKDSGLSCFLSKVELSGIACIRQLFMLADKGGWRINLLPDEFYKHTLGKYADAALFVTVNGTSVYLDPNPHCYVICASNAAKNVNQADSTAAVLQAKYHAHLNNLYDQIITSFEREIDVLQSVCVYSVSNSKKVQGEKTTFGNFCEELLATLLVELGSPADTVSVSRIELTDFMIKHEDSYVRVSKAYLKVMDFVTKSCDRVRSSFLEVIYSEHMALRQHILAQMMAFTKGKTISKKEAWDILCVAPGNCIGIASTIEEWAGREMSDLEVSFVAIEIHNSLARFANSICDKTSSECVRYELIVRNSLHLMQQNIAIRRRYAAEQEVSESIADIPSNSYSTHRSKRWIFTGFLSAVTGLAGEEEIEKLKTVEENLRHVELDNAGEMVRF